MFTMILIKLLIGFVGLWMIALVLGRNEIGQLTPLDFFSSIMLSEIVGNTLYDDQVKFTHLIYALAIWAILAYSMEKLTIRSAKVLQITEGRASLLVDEGIVNQQLLRASSLNFKDLTTMMRERDVFSFHVVETVIYETNGSISVIKKPGFENVQILSIPVIDDGEILTEAFRGRKISEALIRELAEKQGFMDVKQIAYAELKGSDDLWIIPLN
ncbi:DUF421 domain-containing protein [Paenibacillus psychroresistens]|uniref:DUF421 domain-containing protein n=1 Tax=Paenibacillus psychroresistens TaxID=1778678 RepID=A0A6B8RGV4_9BACL|nr:YetF domain-containing protein [Paenibacillus psychroresistens]QGQ94763.1 DUF421 domain-containing protein [Paenibacillus psychroresistens]